jgi:copper chaperone
VPSFLLTLKKQLMETTVKVDNLKCGGCANSIKNALTDIKGIVSVIVTPEADEVRIVHDDLLSLKLAKDELKKLGYPETGTTEGFEKITDNVKSYVSCAIGKITQPKTD